ncbi:MAG: hypothetical protein MJ156_02260, partial [Alphaproteobacteria bacterium]|nr:hypothetical protein [Alphaproteobacteria bacterium]
MKKYLLRFLSISLFLFVGSSYALEHVDFPKTIADVSFKDRVENLKEGYEPFKDAKSYYQIHITQTENTICSEGEKQAIPHFNTGIRKDGVCKVTSCTDGYVPNSSGTACIIQESNSDGGNGQGNKTRNCNDTERMALLEKPHVTEVGNGASGCIVLACEQPDYRVNETKDGCVYVGARCPDSEASRNLLQKPHVYEIGLENSECVVKTCKDGYDVNTAKDGCECVSPKILNGNMCESVAV